MGLGVLEDKQLPHVPGTVLLDDDAAHTEIFNGLKHGTGKDAHVVLSPQPSDDPNDPLNWAWWKKELNIWILCFGAVLNCSTNGPLLNASYFAIAQRLGTPITSVVVISGYNLLAAGASGPLYSALSRRYGKRPCFLISTLFNIIGTAIGESKTSFNYLLAARIIQGFSTSAFESLIFSSVGDTYFVHERGLRVSIITFILYAASGLASIICGEVFDRLGWLWLFHLFQIFIAIQFVLMFLFCPETTYHRDYQYDTDTQQNEKFQELVQLGDSAREQASTHQTISRENPGLPRPSKKTFVQELAVYTGVHSEENFLILVFGPFLSLLNPAACYAIVSAGLLTTFYVGAAIIVSLVFSGPPWLYTVSQVGYLGSGPFLGGMLGTIFSSFTIDRVSKRIARLNNGVYEPEFRLTFMIPTTVFITLGCFLYGYTMKVGAPGPLCSFLWGIMQVGVVLAIASTSSYALDAFRHESNEIFIMAMFFKNFLFYGWSYFVNNWAAENGPAQVLYVFGGVSIFLCLGALPVYVFGKRLRSWWYRHDLLTLLRMKTAGSAVH